MTILLEIITAKFSQLPNSQNAWQPTILPKVTRPYDIFIKILTENVLLALQWEAILVRAVLHLHNHARGILVAVEEDTFARLKAPEVIANQEPWERMDVENSGDVKTVQQAGQKKRKRRKRSGREAEKKQELQKRAAQREKEEQERLRKWEECWERKIEAQEERDRAECCAAEGLCLKPRTQSNIWINVTRDRSIQEIHMSFKHVPVPRPKPPPLPPLRVLKTPEDACVEESATKVDKTTNTIRRKKKCR